MKWFKSIFFLQSLTIKLFSFGWIVHLIHSRPKCILTIKLHCLTCFISVSICSKCHLTIVITSFFAIFANSYEMCSVNENCISRVCPAGVLFNIIWMKYVWLCVPLIIYVAVCACMWATVCVPVFLYQMCIRQLFRTPNKSQKREPGQHILTWWRIIRWV